VVVVWRVRLRARAAPARRCRAVASRCRCLVPREPCPRWSGWCGGVGGNDLVHVEVDLGISVHGDDAKLAPSGLDEPGKGREVEVLASFQFGEVALIDAERLGELLLGETDGAADLAEGCSLVFDSSGDLFAEGPVCGRGSWVGEHLVAGGSDSCGRCGEVFVAESDGLV